jgi:hypothetical protein
MEVLGRKPLIGLMAAILFTTCWGFASWGSHKSSERATNVTFANMMKFQNGETLPAGTYQMEVPQNSQTPTVTFLRNGKVVASSNAKVQSQEKKNPQTEVDSVMSGKAQLITEIRPGGWDEVLKFQPAGK